MTTQKIRDILALFAHLRQDVPEADGGDSGAEEIGRVLQPNQIFSRGR